MISASSMLIANGSFTQNLFTSSRGFELLSQNVATQALHDSGQVADPAKCHPDTRVAILTDLQEWAEGLTYNYPIKWISGSAGVGKTAIMRTTAETLERKKLLLACFFFWRTGERCNSAEFLIATLAYQITISMPETRPYIERAVAERPHIFTQKLEVQVRELITGPITALCSEQTLPLNHPRIILIDGLDECLLPTKQSQDVERQCEILRILHSTLQHLPPSFKLLIASRPEYHIQTVFDTSLKDEVSPLVLNNSSDASADIKRFYIDKFREIRAQHPLRSLLPSPDWPSVKMIEALVRNASGQFIYASTVIKFVSANKKDPSNQLKAILEAKVRGRMRPFQPLDVLYSTILSIVDEEDLPVTLRVLGALWVNRKYHSSPVLWDEFLGLRQGEVQRLVLGLESLLLVKEHEVKKISDYPSIHEFFEARTASKTFQFYHASLGEFLFDCRRSGIFFIDRNMVYEDLAKQGISYLFINPLKHDDMTYLILSQIEMWFKQANPSVELYNAIEQVEIFVRPRDLKMKYPAFLVAIKGSRLPDRDRLYDIKLDLYRSRLRQVVPLYFKEGCLTFLILSRLKIRFDDPMKMIPYGLDPLEYLVDKVCPLSPELRLIDRERGLYLYHDPSEKGESRSTSNLKFQVFKDCVEEAIDLITDVGHSYAKAGSLFVKWLSDRSRFPIEQVHSWRASSIAASLVPMLLEDCFEMAPCEPDLIKCMEKYPIFGDDLWRVKRAIDKYLRNSAWPGIWAAWTNQRASSLRKVARHVRNNPEIDE